MTSLCPDKLAVLGAILLLAIAALIARGGETAGASQEFFEKKIRPVLVEHCYKCHSSQSEKLKGKLRVDSHSALLKGGETGPALVPGNPDKSLLVEAVLYTNQDLQMPPKAKLSEAVIQDIVAWVAKGAPWTDEKEKDMQPVTDDKKLDYDKLRKEHWAFQPIKQNQAPQVKDNAWPLGPIDRFILARLEQKELAPAPTAGKGVLLRRVTFDLIGLPPSAEEIDAFLKDDAPDAFQKVVDRLLASPHFGERWGRHWLDIARYAESAGGGRIVPLGNAWRYRDYVISAFNNDKPYDEFVKEQIAGDLIPGQNLEQRREHLIATGFLAVGPKNLDTQDKDLLRMDVADEQMDTLGKALLGTTIGCARCHDHKFDPIPTRDYYALAGIFRSTKTLTPGNVSGVVQAVLPADNATQEQIDAYEKKVTALEARIEKFRANDEPLKPLAAALNKNAPGAEKIKSKIDPATLPGIVVDDSQANIVGTWIHSTVIKPYVGEGYIHDHNKFKGELSVSFSPAFPKTGIYEVRFSYAHAADRADRVPIIIQHADGETTVAVDERKEPAVDGLFVSLGRFRFNQGNDGSVTVSNTGTKSVVTVDAVQFLPVLENETAANPIDKQILAAQKTANGTPAVPIAAKKSDAQILLDEKKKQVDAEAALLKQLEAELMALKKTQPPGPAALAVRDEEQVSDYNVCLRGDVHRLGQAVPRGFLTLVSFDSAAVNSKQSGRMELAQWIVDRRNPLTSRVMVNRIWHHLFGAGLVGTTDNFGTTGDAPTHPELLDFLAAQFMENGWSVKKAVRAIILTRTYQQAVAQNVAAARVDPENHLLWRANRRRLEVEPFRDAILMNSAQLNLSGSPGATTPKAEKGKAQYRTVYLPLPREAIDDALEIFDFADTNLVMGKRNTSNLPTQALFLMNSPFVIEQSQLSAQQLLAAPGTSTDDSARIDLAYLKTLGRPPTDTERKLSQSFLANAGGNEAAWAQFYQSLFACVDFRYLE